MSSSKAFVLWGDNDTNYKMSEDLLSFLLKRMNVNLKSEKWDGFYDVPSVETDKVLKEELEKYVSYDHISFSPEERFLHSFGRGGTDYAKLIEKKIKRVVDAVIYPDLDELKNVLTNIRPNIGLITFGGGTTVTEGVTPSNSKEFFISIDTRNLSFISIHKDSMSVEAGAGLLGPQLEKLLNKEGLTLGHFPESFKYSTLGGWIATNAAGQESNRYGKMKDIVSGLELMTPRGTFKDRVVPNESAFFGVRDVAVGSEGALGVITSASLKVRNIPSKMKFNSLMFRSFEDAVRSVEKVFKEAKAPMVARLSDPTETNLSLLGIENNFLTVVFKRYLKARNVLQKGSLLIVVDDGNGTTDFKDGIRLGSSPAKIWRKTRFERPYMYNELLKYGILADTIETATEWPNILPLYNKVTQEFAAVLESNKLNGIIMCHLSHEYLTGSALYFTFLFNSESDKMGKLEILRKTVLSSILESGGAISHHHGIGRSFGDSFKKYKGNNYELIKVIKRTVDPDNIMNPGVLDIT